MLNDDEFDRMLLCDMASLANIVRSSTENSVHSFYFIYKRKKRVIIASCIIYEIEPKLE